MFYQDDFNVPNDYIERGYHIGLYGLICVYMPIIMSTINTCFTEMIHCALAKMTLNTSYRWSIV